MNTTETTTEITNLFTQTRLCVEKLSLCLSAELDSLKNNDAELLMKNSTSKQNLMAELNSLDQQRKKLTSACQITSKDDYLSWLKSLDTSLSLKEQWLEISDQIKQCQKQNATNGIISEKMASASMEVLNILSGNTVPVDTTYTAAGTKPGSKASLHNTTA